MADRPKFYVCDDFESPSCSNNYNSSIDESYFQQHKLSMCSNPNCTSDIITPIPSKNKQSDYKNKRKNSSTYKFIKQTESLFPEKYNSDGIF